MKDNISTQSTDDESSDFTGSLHGGAALDFGSFSSDRFSNIELLYSSSAGRMEIYSAIRYGRRFILKAITESFRDDPVINLVLRKEFEIGISLDHPNIRRTVGFEKIPELGWAIVLEYIDGEPLDRAIANGRITPDNARTVAGQLAAAIEYLHNRQTVHRDIKPANILFTHAGNTVKLIDFSLSDSEAYIIIKNPAGTRKYMAPEQLLPDARASVKADIYSFGLIARQLAGIGGDRELMAVADACAAADPDDRPESFSAVRVPRQADFRPAEALFDINSPRLTKLLVAIAAVMAAVVAGMLYARHLNIL